MKTLKKQLGTVLLCLLEIAVGVLLLINPEGFTSAIILTLGVALLACGLYFIIKYFRADVEEAAKSQNMLKGLIVLLAGGFCIMKVQWFIATFQILTVVYGLAILVTGLGKVQWTVDMLRMKKENWFFAAISALISIICATIILANPFSDKVLWIFTGIALIIEGVVDIVTLLINSKNDDEEEEVEEIEE